MNPKECERLSRRAFLRVLGCIPASHLASKLPIMGRMEYEFPGKDGLVRDNILIIVLDALPASHLPLYGYVRNTAPNLSRFAEGATVFHRHYSAGNFTTPGTASLITGTYPWSHRAMHMYGTLANEYRDKTIFQAIEGDRFSFAYTQNPIADGILYQLRDGISEHLPIDTSSIFYTAISDEIFSRDLDAAMWAEMLYRGIFSPLERSNLLSMLINAIQQPFIAHRLAEYAERYPRGIPTNERGLFFTLEQTTDWILGKISSVPRPFLGYIHLYPPHFPYSPEQKFVEFFKDSWAPRLKPPHFFTEGRDERFLNEKRRQLDDYIASLDAEFGRLVRKLEEDGVLDDTYLILTSDHGTMFERGIWAHMNPTLFEPIIHIPLVISSPGQSRRRDVRRVTSSVDILPTIAKITSNKIPDWCEGEVLPTFRSTPGDLDRHVFAVEAKSNAKSRPLTTATVSLIGRRRKLTHYFGYQGFEEEYELYDLESDPDELVNIYSPSDASSTDLRDRILERIQLENMGMS